MNNFEGDLKENMIPMKWEKCTDNHKTEEISARLEEARTMSITQEEKVSLALCENMNRINMIASLIESINDI